MRGIAHESRLKDDHPQLLERHSHLEEGREAIRFKLSFLTER